MGIEEGEEIQIKGNYNLFNIIASVTLRKRESPVLGSLLTGPKKKHPQKYHHQSTQQTEQERILKATREKMSNI
jgi:hypothetical protein